MRVLRFAFYGSGAVPRLSPPVAVRAEACETAGAEGLWAGILIPQAGRGRGFALKQLRSLAERMDFQSGKRDSKCKDDQL